MRIALLFLGAALLCFCGCRSRLVQTDSPRSDPDGAKVEVVAVQYVPPVGTMEDLTVEILLHNRGSRPVTFVGAELNGVPLPPIRGKTQEVLQAFDVEGLPVRRSFPKPVAGVRWWQFYPSATLQANGFAAFQVNFAGRARPSRLELTTADGAILSAAVSAYYPVVRRIVHLGVTGDGGRISVAHSAGEPPTSVRLNGAAVPFRALRPADAGRAGAVIAAPPRPIREGEPLLVELGFADGVRCFGLVRALRGIFTVAPDGWNESRALPEAVRNRYGFDEGLRIGRLPLDAVCDDARAGVCGASSRELVGARCARFRAKPQELCGVDICTALHRPRGISTRPSPMPSSSSRTRCTGVQTRRASLARRSHFLARRSRRLRRVRRCGFPNASVRGANWRERSSRCWRGVRSCRVCAASASTTG